MPRLKIFDYEPCYVCKVYSQDILPLDDGRTICEGCSYEKCSKCFSGEPEVETNDGEYICSDCYFGMVDSAYEYGRD